MLKLVLALLFVFTTQPPIHFPIPQPKLPKPHPCDGGKKKCPLTQDYAASFPRTAS